MRMLLYLVILNFSYLSFCTDYIENDMHLRDMNPQKKYELGLKYYYKKDLDLAYFYFEYAALEGHTEAEFKYGLILYEVKKNCEKARHYLRLAAMKGHDLAQYNYANMLLNGQGGEIDLTEAQHYFALSALQGNSSSQYLYAFMLINEGYQNLEEALHYLYLAAVQEHKEAKIKYNELLPIITNRDKKLFEN